jgi:hypothetical protein
MLLGKRCSFIFAGIINMQYFKYRMTLTLMLNFFEVLSRRTIFYDVIDYLYNQRITPRLRQEIPILVQRPVSQEIKVQHIRAISTLRYVKRAISTLRCVIRPYLPSGI